MKNNIIKLISSVMLFTFISKILGLIRELVVAYVFGANKISDAYIIGTMLSQICYTGIANALFSAYIPIAARIESKNKKHLNELTSNLINCTMILLLIISIILTYNSSFIINCLAGNANQGTKEMAEVFFRLSTIPSSFLILAYILMGYMQIHSQFVANLIFSVPMNFSIIMGIFIGKNNYKMFAIMYAISLILPALMLFIFSVIKSKYRYFSIIDFKDKETKEIYILFSPIFIGGILSQLGEIIDKTFAVSLSEGIVSSLKYGKLLETTVVSIIAISIGQVIFPKLVQMATEKYAYQKLNSYVSNVLIYMLILIIPITAEIIIFSKDIVKFVLMHGAFDNTALIITSNSLAIYALSIPAVCFAEIIFRVFYSLKKSKLPTIVFSSCMLLNIFLDYIATQILNLGYQGLALTTSFIEWLSMIICSILLVKLIGKLNIMIMAVIKIIFATLISSITSIVVYFMLIKKFEFKCSLYFIIAIIFAFITNIVILYLLNIKKNLKN